jgi:hypothetical protein
MPLDFCPLPPTGVDVLLASAAVQAAVMKVDQCEEIAVHVKQERSANEALRREKRSEHLLLFTEGRKMEECESFVTTNQLSSNPQGKASMVGASHQFHHVSSCLIMSHHVSSCLIISHNTTNLLCLCLSLCVCVSLFLSSKVEATMEAARMAFAEADELCQDKWVTDDAFQMLTDQGKVAPNVQSTCWRHILKHIASLIVVHHCCSLCCSFFAALSLLLSLLHHQVI